MIPDAYDLWRYHEAEQQRQLDRCRVCAECREPIQQEHVECVDGFWLCDDCFESYRKDVQI